MIIIEFFSGTKSLSNTAIKEGHKTFTIDIEPILNPDLPIDILDFDVSMLPEEFKKPDLIWFSPPCTKYSHAHRKGEKDLTHSNRMVLKSLEIIKELKPRFWIIENPQTGTLKNQHFMEDLPFSDASYCKYGLPYRKQTRFWNNAGLVLETCKKDCGYMDGKRHLMSVGNGRRGYTKDLRFAYVKELKYKIPERLIESILYQLMYNLLTNFRSEV